jgi:hypothetical protein
MSEWNEKPTIVEEGFEKIYVIFWSSIGLSPRATKSIRKAFDSPDI